MSKHRRGSKLLSAGLQIAARALQFSRDNFSLCAHIFTMGTAPSRFSTHATVNVGAHFDPEFRRRLFLLQANDGRRLKELLSEALNDLFAKYSDVLVGASTRAVAARAPATSPRPKAEKTSTLVSLEPKTCEKCGASFLRVIGDPDTLCSACEASLEAVKRKTEASLASARRDLADVDVEAPKKVARGRALTGKTKAVRARRRKAAIENGIVSRRSPEPSTLPLSTR